MDERRSEIDQLAINTIRMLAVDAVQKANSGHPGTPMDAAPTAYVLWQRFLRYDPADPHWLNRDRFVLSSGHASMLLYSLIYLTGIKAANPSYEQLDRDAVTLEDIKNFRQAGSRPRRQHAVMGTLRCPGTGLSAKRATPRGDGKGHGRGSVTNRLGAICWAMRRGPRNAQLRHVGADEDCC